MINFTKTLSVSIHRTILIFSIISFLSINITKSQTISIYTSPNGVDTGIGASLSSSVNLKRAIIVAKLLPKDTINIMLSDGIYSQLVLDSTSSRNATAPVYFQAINRGKAIFQTLTNINTSAFVPIPDSIKQRIVDSTAKTKVLQLPLTSLNLKNMTIWPNTFGIANLTSPKFYNKGVVLPMSRYPKDSTMFMKTVLNNGTSGKFPGGTFVYRNDRCKFWLKEIKDAGLFLSGAWRVPWQIDVVKTQFIDIVADTIQQVVGVSGGIGDKYTRPAGNGKEPYWAINLVEEISTPGEWSINFRTKMLYMWVPDSAVLQVASDPTQAAFSLKGVNYTNFQGIVIDGGAGDGFTLTNCNNSTIAGCDINNCSGNGVTITGGKNCTVLSNDIHDLGGTAVKIASANYLNDQMNVTFCNHRVVNNNLYNLAIEKQVYFGGVDISTAIGAYVGYNLMHDMPHMAIYFGGNSNTMEYNEVYNAQNKYGGAAVFYRTGNFADRGNIMQHNYVHDSPHGGGLSEDNQGTGDSMMHNILEALALGTNNNGGFADTYTSNIYVDIAQAHGSAITKDTSATYIKYYKNLQIIYNGSAAYRAAYPSVAAMLDTVGGVNKAFTSLEWNQMNCNVFMGNTIVFGGIKDTAFFNTNGTQKASAITAKAAAFKTYGTVVHDNFKMNGVLLNPIVPFKIDSLKKVKAFSKTCDPNWHINRIGLYKDNYRTNIDSTITPGISPTISWLKNSMNGDTTMVNAVVVNPNIANSISSVQFFLDSVAVKPISITPTSLSYDTISYKAVFVDIPVGKHAIGLSIYDTPNWQYNAGLDTFSINRMLPITFTSLKGSTVGCNANLHWTITNEKDINGLELEQSSDGINFETIKTIQLNENNNGNLLLNQTTIPLSYYRLKILEKDGEISYSNTVPIKVNCGDQSSLTVFPIPAKDLLQVQFNALNFIQKGWITLTDASGKQVFSQEHTIVQGINDFSINLKSVANGTYSLLLKDSNGILARKTVMVCK